MNDAQIRLDDKFLKTEGTVFLTGIEAILRLILDKQRRDLEQGHVNQTYISGYEGSPLGGLDLQVVKHLDLLNANGRTVHQFGINEKTAASAMLGTQYGAEDVDAFWYGKAHGTMWIPDEAWLANLAGSAARGSMVLLCGEDHRSKSSVSPGSSDWALRSAMVPIFYPASVQDVLDLGGHAVALSRYCGLVTALKLVTPVCDGAGTVEVGPQRLAPVWPATAFTKTFHPIVMATGALPMQRQLVEQKLPLALEYIRLNGLNRIFDAEAGGEVGIVTTGKSLTDLRQALAAMGLRVPILHLAVPYPLDTQIVRRFAAGLKRVYIVEEPGPFVEEAVQAALWGTGVETVCGQWDEAGKPFIPAYGEVDPEVLVQKLWSRLKGVDGQPGDGRAVARLETIMARPYPSVPTVTPMSCGGCPYNTFRDLKEKPGGAIGCSSIRAIDAYDNGVLYIPTMGAGGSIYSGAAPFNGNKHIYQYLGDGSYFHSGRGAIQSCVQAGVNITYLLLFNGAVALTGGQAPGGQRPVAEVVRELLALGVVRVGVVSEDPARYGALPADAVDVFGLERHAEALQRYKGIAGTTVLILDKECATERGRRQKRQGIKPQKYVMIDAAVCEGCGDCNRQSEGCAALYRIDTPLGDKTRIRQSSCAQDGLCIDGECPSFIEVETTAGGGLRRRRPEPLDGLPEPVAKPGAGPWTILAVGRGGTGVVTVSHLLAYAAMLGGQKVYLSNNTGLAQKGGPVEAPIVIGGEAPAFNRLFPGQVDLYLGFDLLRAAETAHLRYVDADKSLALVSSSRLPNARMNRNPDERFPDTEFLRQTIDGCTRANENVYLDTYALAETLFADSLYANMLLVGAAYQAGALPLEAADIETAIRLNGKGVEDNLLAFRWGRLAVAEPERVGQVLAEAEAGADSADRDEPLSPPEQALYDEAVAAVAPELRDEIAVRVAGLCRWGGVEWARRYWSQVAQVMARDSAAGHWALTRAVARQLYRVMAYKDEYEVARLLTRPGAAAELGRTFDGRVKRYLRLHPPTLRRLGLGKLRLGPWVTPLLGLLKRSRVVRGTRFDPFGYTACRRLERQLIPWYEAMVRRVLPLAEGDRYAEAAALLDSVDGIRGYEEVKIRNAERIKAAFEKELKALEDAARAHQGR